MNTFFDCGRYRFPLKEGKPLVMGILNVTPDSFSDGGNFNSLDSAISHAEHMLNAGVDIIDIGGESSRPGSKPLPLDEELKRVLPLIYALRDCGKPLSIDTYKPEVMREAILAGADMINDIRGFTNVESHSILADSDVALCVMHMQNNPSNMQQQPLYDDVRKEVSAFLQTQCQTLLSLGIAKERLCIDPGFGFGKTLAHNIALFQHIQQFSEEFGLPLLAGVSRKTMIGEITEKPIEKRQAGSVAAALAAVARGAKIVRVHDVADTIDAIKVWRTLAVN